MVEVAGFEPTASWSRREQRVCKIVSQCAALCHIIDKNTRFGHLIVQYRLISFDIVVEKIVEKIL